MILPLSIDAAIKLSLCIVQYYCEYISCTSFSPTYRRPMHIDRIAAPHPPPLNDVTFDIGIKNHPLENGILSQGVPDSNFQIELDVCPPGALPPISSKLLT